MKRVYDKKEEIPKGLEALYEDQSGKWVLKAIEGLKPIEDFVTVQKELTETKAKLTEYGTKYDSVKDWDFKDIQSKIDKYNEFETKGKFKDSKDDDTKLNELVKIKTAEYDREIARLKKEFETAVKDRDILKTEKVKNILDEKIRAAIYDKDKGQYRVYESCIPDIKLNAMTFLEYNEANNEFYTKDDKKLKLSEWLDPIAKERQWYKGSKGDNDKGSSDARGKTNSDGKPLRGEALINALLK